VKEFLDLVYKRSPNKPLITVSNHYSCSDDPMIWGSSLPLSCFLFPERKSFRWCIGAHDVCFTNKWHSLFFRLGNVSPVVRGAGVYQPVMNEMLDKLNSGHWLHIFPEGRINLEKEFIRLKWGVGRLIADCKETPIVLPLYHLGMDSILPNKHPYRPKTGQITTVVFGKPIYFDELVNDLKKKQKTSIEIRKQITDIVQDEFYKLKQVAIEFHEKNLLQEYQNTSK
jgi:monolysocardiolipin acyltransferase